MLVIVEAYHFLFSLLFWIVVLRTLVLVGSIPVRESLLVMSLSGGDYDQSDDLSPFNRQPFGFQHHSVVSRQGSIWLQSTGGLWHASPWHEHKLQVKCTMLGPYHSRGERGALPSLIDGNGHFYNDHYKMRLCKDSFRWKADSLCSYDINMLGILWTLFLERLYEREWYLPDLEPPAEFEVSLLDQQSEIWAMALLCLWDGVQRAP